MNWDSKLDAVLMAADDSVAKIKERLNTRGDTIRDFCYDSTPVRRSVQYDDRSAIKPASPYAPFAYTHTALVSSEDMVNLSSQLLSQAKMITSLHEAIGRLERDRDLHIQRIQSLEAEVQRLAASRGPDLSESVLERKMAGLRQELSGELRHLEDRVKDSSTCGLSPSLRSAISISQEMSETKKLICKELESLLRDTDYMHQRLRRQEDDLRQHITDGQELMRTQERHGAVLERIQSCHQVQTQELERVRSDTQGAHREIQRISLAIGDLQEDVSVLERKASLNRTRSERPDHRRCRQRQELSRSVSSSSADDDYSQISLADISSEDTSLSLGAAAAAVSRAWGPGIGSCAGQAPLPLPLLSLVKAAEDRTEEGRLPQAVWSRCRMGALQHTTESREKSTTSRDGRSRSDSDHDLDELSDSAPELNFSDL